MTVGAPNPNPVPIRGWLSVPAGLNAAAADNTPALHAARDRAAALRAAAVAAGQPEPTVRIHIPSAPTPYTFAGPVFNECPNIEFVCEPGTTLNQAAGCGYPLFVAGMPRAGLGTTAPFRPDLWAGGTPKLDATAVAGPGRRWGWDSQGKGFLFQHGGAFTHGGMSPAYPGLHVADAWVDTTALTVEFAVENPAGGAIPAGTTIGLGGSPFSPWSITADGSGGWQLGVSTQSRRWATPVTTTFTFASGNAAGVQRVAFQIDLPNNVVAAYAGGNGAAPVRAAVAGGPLPSGVILNQNVGDILVINGLAGQTAVPFGQASTPRVALYGLCLSRTARYVVGAVGAAQVPHPQCAGYPAFALLSLCGAPTGGTYTLSYGGQTTAPIAATATAGAVQSAFTALSTVGAGNVTVAGNVGGPFTLAAAGGFAFARSGTSSVGVRADGSSLAGAVVSDGYRYFPAANQAAAVTDPNALAYLAFAEDPAAVDAPRHLSATGGHTAAEDVASSVFLGHVDLYGAGQFTPNQRRNAWRGMTVVNWGGYGMGFLVTGGVNDTETSDVVCEGSGIYGFAVLRHGANYIHRFDRCRFNGTDAPIFLNWSAAELSKVNFLGTGRAAIKSFGAVVSAVDVNVTAWSPQNESYAQHYSGGYGGNYRYVNATSDYEGPAFGRAAFLCELEDYTSATTLTLRDVTLQTLGDVPLVELHSRPLAAAGPGIFTADNVGSALGRAFARTDGNGWMFDIRGSATTAFPHVEHAGAGSPPGTYRDRFYRTPMRVGRWYAGSSVFDVPSPPDGGFASFRSARAGTWGSASPPGFVGLGAAPLDPNASLAAVGIAHAASSATASGNASAWGMPTYSASSSVSSALFAGAALSPPPTWYFALATADAGRYGMTAEASGGGYARAAVANGLAAFPAAASGAKSNAVAIAFPTLSAPVVATALVACDAATNGTAWHVWKFPAPVTFAAGTAPAVPIGGLTWANAPVPGPLGTLTDYGFGRVYDCLFGGQALGAPATWYAALSTAAMTRSSAGPAEPAGGYARVAVAATSSAWRTNSTPDQQPGDASNIAPATFPSPTGAQGTIVAAALMDLAAGGHPWYAAPLSGTPSPVGAGAAPTFAPGALYFGF